VVGSTVSSWALAEWATIRVLPLAVAWMPLRLTAPFPLTLLVLSVCRGQAQN
jgi:hypothetical protein